MKLIAIQDYHFINTLNKAFSDRESLTTFDHLHRIIIYF